MMKKEIWLKCGTIGFVIWLASLILGGALLLLDNLLFCSGDVCGTFLSMISLVFFYISLGVPMLFGKAGLNDNFFFFILGIILNILLFFLIAAFISWKLSKRKVKNKK